MGYTYYSRMMLIPASVNMSFDSIQAIMEKKFSWSKHQVITRPKPNKIEITFNEWTYHISWDAQPLQEEIKEIAELFAKEREDKDIIASCPIVMGIWGDPDPNMNHFDTYVAVIEELDVLPNVYHFDSYDGKLWKSGDEYWKTNDSPDNQNP